MTDVGVFAEPRRLPFSFRAKGGSGRLVLARQVLASAIELERLELEVPHVSVEEPDDAPPERFQRRRAQLSRLVLKIGQDALRQRIEATRRQLAALGISQVQARFCDGFVSVRARVADGLAVADLSLRVLVAASGPNLRVMAGGIRVHGHLPLPGPLVADRVLTALLAVGEQESEARATTRGLCDVEIDLVGALLWQLLPSHGWRLPKTSGIELTSLRIARSGIEIGYAPLGARADSGVGIGAAAIQLAAAHDLMRTADELLLDGQLEEAMRGYRSLLASGGPDQPVVLGRLLALAVTRSAWYYDGVELARQALARWPHYAPAHAALAGILLAQGDAREAASHLHALARLASGEGDDDEAALAALAGARLLRILDPRTSTQLYQLALEHDPGSTESADALADRLSDEGRWAELVRLLRARAVVASADKAAQLRLRLAEVLASKLGDDAGAQAEVATARDVAPTDPAVHELWAQLRQAAGDRDGASAAWRLVIELAQRRSEPGDRRTEARAWARLGALADSDAAEAAWRRALELYPAEPEAIEGLARLFRERGEHAEAILLYERVRGSGLPLTTAAHFELEMAKCQIELGRLDDARAALRRAAVGRSETAAEAHALLADISATSDPHHAAAELDTAISSLVDLAEGAFAAEGHRLFRRAAQLAVQRAGLLDRQGDEDAAAGDLQRAHYLAANHDAQVARLAAHALLERAGDDPAAERRWLDAVLATEPAAAEKAELLMQSASARRRQSPPDVGTALAEARESSRLSPDPELRKRAFELEAELLADLGNQRARATALSSLAELTNTDAERAAAEVAAAAAWLAADDAAAALPHAAAAAGIAETPEAAVAPALRRHILATFGEAAWRQRSWSDVVRAYSELVGDTPPGAAERAGYLLRIATAADKRGDLALARESALAILEAERPNAPSAALAELRGSALRILAELADHAGDGPTAAATLERLASAPAAESTPVARADALYRAGELFRRAGQSEDAVRCLEAALRLSDAHLPALDSLELAWRSLGDLERVAVVLGRKVAATRQSARQKSLLVRLGDLQAQLGRPDVARATHRRALEIDPTWRPSLRYLAGADLRAGQLASAARTYAALAGELASDAALPDPEEVERDRAAAALALADLLPALDDSAEVSVAQVALVPHRHLRAVEAALAASEAHSPVPLVEITGEHPPVRELEQSEAPTLSGKSPDNGATSEQFRATARAARQRGDLSAALAALETAQHLVPHDAALLGELVEVAQQVGDLPAAARHLRALARTAATANRRADALIELADLYYDQLDDPRAARAAMLEAAEALGATARGDATLRMVASEAATHLAWHTVVAALERIAFERQTGADLTQLATALCRCGRDAAALELVQSAHARLGPAGQELLRQLRQGQEAKHALADELEARATAAVGEEADALWAELEVLCADGLGDHERAERAAGHRRLAVEAARRRGATADEHGSVTDDDRGEDGDGVAAGLGASAAAETPTETPTETRTETRTDSPATRIAAPAVAAADRADAAPAGGADDRDAGARADDRDAGARADDRDAGARADDATDDRVDAAPAGGVATKTTAATELAPASLDMAHSDERAAAAPTPGSEPTSPDREPAAAPSPDRKPAAAPSPDREPAAAPSPDREPAAAPSPDLSDDQPAPPRLAAAEEPAERPAAMPRQAEPPARPSRSALARALPQIPQPPRSALPASPEPPPAPGAAADAPAPLRRAAAPDDPTAAPNVDESAPLPPAPRPGELGDDDVTNRMVTPAELMGVKVRAAARALDRAPAAALPVPGPRAVARLGSGEEAPVELEDQATGRFQRAPAPASDPEAGRQSNLLSAAVELASHDRARTITSAIGPTAREPAPPRRADASASSSAERPPAKSSRWLGRVVDPAAEARREAASLFRLANAELARGRLDAATALLTRGYHLDRTYAPILLPLADRLAAGGDLPAAYRVFGEAAVAPDLSEARRRWACARAEALRAQAPELPALPEPRRTPPALAAQPAELRRTDLAPAVEPPRERLELASTVELEAQPSPDEAVAARASKETRAPAEPAPSAAAEPAAPAEPEIAPAGGSASSAQGRTTSPPAASGVIAVPGGASISAQLGAAAEPLTAVLDLIDAGNLPQAIAAAERAAAEAEVGDLTALELLEDLYLEIGDGAAASEAIGRQLMMTEDPLLRATLWRRRARVYRELGREQQAYRCLKEAHACAPQDADHAYELRCAAMARREWPLVITLLEHEIATAISDRDRAALHLELGLIFDERMDDGDRAIEHYEHALALDPSIPAVDLPLARRYERQGRLREAAAHYESAQLKAPGGAARLAPQVLSLEEPRTASPSQPRAVARSTDEGWDPDPDESSAPTAADTSGAAGPSAAPAAPSDRSADRAASESAQATAEAPPTGGYRFAAGSAVVTSARPRRPSVGEDRSDLPQTVVSRSPSSQLEQPTVGRRTSKRFPLVDASLAALEPAAPEFGELGELGGPAEPPPAAPPTIPELEHALDEANEHGERSEVVAAARRLWQHCPGHVVAFQALASEHKLNGDLDALVELTAVRAAMTSEGAERAGLWVEVARLADLLGEDHQAARAYDLALIEDPSSSVALDARAGLAFRLGDFATAEMIYRDIDAADSMLPPDELLLRRSIIAEHLDRAGEALTYAQAAAAAAPGRIELQRRVQELATRAGDLATALPAARAVMALVPPDQEDEVLASHFSLVGLLHAIGDHAGAIANLERLRRDHPQNREVIAALASVHADRGDWSAACQYLQMLVPLAATAQERALRLFELGEVFLNKVGDLERADDAFLRASDLDPGCVPALRRLIDSYWRADQIGPLLDIATDLVTRGALLEPEMDPASLARAAVVAAVAQDYPLARQVLTALGADAAAAIASVLIELVGRSQALTVTSACRALRALHDQGVADLGAIVAVAEHPAVRKALQQAAAP